MREPFLAASYTIIKYQFISEMLKTCNKVYSSCGFLAAAAAVASSHVKIKFVLKL